MRMNLSNAALASKLEPSTGLEKEVEMLLTAGGACEAGLAEKELEELKSKVSGWGPEPCGRRDLRYSSPLTATDPLARSRFTSRHLGVPIDCGGYWRVYFQGYIIKHPLL